LDDALFKIAFEQGSIPRHRALEGALSFAKDGVYAYKWSLWNETSTDLKIEATACPLNNTDDVGLRGKGVMEVLFEPMVLAKESPIVKDNCITSAAATFVSVEVCPIQPDSVSDEVSLQVNQTGKYRRSSAVGRAKRKSSVSFVPNNFGIAAEKLMALKKQSGFDECIVS
jgi:hypothetical protein